MSDPLILPVRMHFKNGRYYYVKRGGPKNTPVWTGLSRNQAEAMAQYTLLEAGKPREAFEKYDAPAFWLGEVSKTVWEQTKKRAREKDILFMLTVDDIVEFGMASNWRCSVSGVKFTRDKPGTASRKPFMPSIDRIDCSKGYVKLNCRLVCWAANLAMSDWGEGVLAQLALSYVQHHGYTTSVRVTVRKTDSKTGDDSLSS